MASTTKHSGGDRTSESFILCTHEASKHLKAMQAAVKDIGLRVDEMVQVSLDQVPSERLLRILLSSAADAPEEQQPSHSVHGPGSTQRMFGSTLGSMLMTGPLSQDYNPSRPTLDEVDAYCSGPVTALLVACIDPRVDVVARASALVGSDSLPVAALADNCLQRRFRSISGIAQVLAPNNGAAATRALHLLREYKMRALAAPGSAGGGTMSGTASPADLATLSGMRATSTAARSAISLSKQYLVDMDTLFDFVFPPGQQHPSSTGRLLLAALHGPLTLDGRLTGGKQNSRPLTETEINAMIEELERDDILAVYTAGSVMGDLNQVLVDVRAASRGYPNLSRRQAEAMLVDLPRDSHGRCSFHDIQKRVLGARLQRVEDMRQMFPAVTASERQAAAGGAANVGSTVRIRAPPRSYGRGKLAETTSMLHGRSLSLPRSGATQRSAKALAASARSMALPAAAASVVGGLDVNRKMGPVESFRVGEELLVSGINAKLRHCCVRMFFFVVCAIATVFNGAVAILLFMCGSSQRHPLIYVSLPSASRHSCHCSTATRS